MLLIRAAQMQALEEAAVAPIYEARMVEYLRGRHAKAVAGLSADDLLALVRRLSERARSYGANGFPAAAQFLELAMMFGADFGSEPWAAAILSEAGSPFEAKVARLVAAAPGSKEG
jgi:hypothetical protein